MICSQCGKNNPDDSRFCDGCGNTLQSAVSSPHNQGYTAPPPPPPPQYQQSYQQPQYQQPASYNNGGDTSPLSVGQYIGMYLLTMIPMVGFILLLIWAFSSDTNVNKKNWAKAMLIIMLIGIVLAIVFSVALGGLIASIMNSMSYY